MKHVVYDRGRIVEAPPEVVACLWSNWEIYDAVLGNPFGIRRTAANTWKVEYVFRPSVTLEVRDAGIDAGRFVYTLRANVMGIPSATVATLSYERLTSGNTAVHGRFESELTGIAEFLEPLVRGRIQRAVDRGIEGGQRSCETIAKEWQSLKSRLSAAHVSTVETYLDTAKRLRDGHVVEQSLLRPSIQAALPIRPVSHAKNVFVVHGRDEATMKEVAAELVESGCTPIVLREQPNLGRTLIEKFEEHADADYAVVLLTPDDTGGLYGADGLRPRARQNVVFEMGYFIGRINRRKVCALYSDGVELPSDLGGLLYIPLDESGRWKAELCAEMSAAGFALRDRNAGAKLGGD